MVAENVGESGQAAQGRTSRRIAAVVAGTAIWAVIVWGGAFLSVRERGRVYSGGHWSQSLDRYARVAPLARLDSYWYSSIALGGYEWRPDGAKHNVGFFPLYPAILGMIHRATGVHPFVAGSVVSLIALLFGIRFAVLLAADEGFDPVHFAAALLLFPFAFFFVAVYAESLFLLLSAGCLLAVRREQPARSAVFGFLASLARPMGFLLSLPILWRAWERSRRNAATRRRTIGMLAASAAPLAGMGTFAAYLGIRFGDPLLYLRTQSAAWKHRLLPVPWSPLVRAVFWAPTLRTEAALVIVFSILSVTLFLRGFRSEAVYSAGTILFILEADSMPGSPRYLMLLFPCFFLAGDWMRRSRTFRWLYAAAGAAGLAYRAVYFAKGGSV